MRTVVLMALLLGACTRRGSGQPHLDRLAREPSVTARVSDERLVFHPIHLDRGGAIVPWSQHAAPFHEVVAKGFGVFVSMPAAEHGHPPYFSASLFEGP